MKRGTEGGGKRFYAGLGNTVLVGTTIPKQFLKAIPKRDDASKILHQN